MKKNNVLVSIDLGTSKTTVLVGDFDDTGELNIVGLGNTESNGIDKGIVVKPKDAILGLKKSIYDAETSSGVRIDSAIVNIGGQHLESKNISDFLTFGSNQKEIDEIDILTLVDKVSERVNQEQYKVIHIIPKKFILDDEDEVIDPKGFIASKILGEFHVVLCKVNTYANFKKVIESAGIKVIDFVANPIASAASTLYQEEKEMGVLLIDIGGGTTDIAVLKNGSFEFIKTIPVGGNRITLDIAHRFRISKSDAEELKIDFGLAIVEALTENKILEINPIGSEEIIEISQYELVDTIEARLEEIFNIVKQEVEAANLLDKINGGVVITGGVANTPYIKELAASIFNTDVRIGKPKDYRGFSDKLNYPEYSTPIGIMLFKKNNFNFEKKSVAIKEESDILSILKNILEKIKSIF
ncbi:MAG: cell division protein FtsA [Aquificota bacterium]|nr:MAG: cell division protein FtsA [Aquificota bacterium]